MPRRLPADPRVVVTTCNSDLGWIAFASADEVLAELSFGYSSASVAAGNLHIHARGRRNNRAWPELVERLSAYAAGEPVEFADIAVDLGHLTPLSRRVIEHCRRIPFGQTVTYGRLATLAGAPGAARAVGSVMASNRCALVIPCHRVVAAGGQVGRYSAGAGQRTKLRLLEQEGAVRAGKIRVARVAR